MEGTDELGCYRHPISDHRRGAGNVWGIMIGAGMKNILQTSRLKLNNPVSNQLFGYDLSPSRCRSWGEDPLSNLMFNVENYGLRVAQTFVDALRNASIERFGLCY